MPGVVFADCIELFHLWQKEHNQSNQSDFSVDHLVMSMCRAVSWVGKECFFAMTNVLS